MKPTGLSAKVVLVTGAARGIGAAVARAAFDEGARVVLADRDGDAAGALARTWSADGASARGEALDVTDPAAVDTLFDRIERDWGGVDGVVNVAGVLSHALVVDTSADDWRRVFAVNADGVFNVSRAAARRMIPRRTGAIVTVASNAAGVPRHGMAAYAASKAAAAMFTRSLGLELAGFGIRCNVVLPGSTRTAMLEPLLDNDGERRLIEGLPGTFKTGIPLGKIAEPTDVADAVIFLLSDRASHITAASLYVDGGASLQG